MSARGYTLHSVCPQLPSFLESEIAALLSLRMLIELNSIEDGEIDI